MTRIGRHTAIFTFALLVAALAAAGTALAAEEYVAGTPAERNPSCQGSSAIALDTDELRNVVGEDIIPEEQQSIPLRLSIGDEKVILFCSGEHWDGQDPNTRDSSEDTRASEDGDVYVNPLGDCSGWDGSGDQGCDGGSEKPPLTEPIDLRVTGTADAEATGDDRTLVLVYFNGETWGVGRMSIAVEHDQTNGNGYAAIFLEDHSDQIFSDEGLLGDFGQGEPLDQGWDGNYLTPLFGPIQAGEVGESDCSSDRYESENKDCPRDNGAFTLEYGLNWAPAAPTPNALP